MIKVLVCGGRDFKDYPFLSEVLNGLWDEKGQLIIINGAAEGADLLASKWAYDNKIPCWRFPANWDLYGKAAGPLRNKQMLEENPDIVIAFPGGKGTANMVKQARERGIEVREIQ